MTPNCAAIAVAF